MRRPAWWTGSEQTVRIARLLTWEIRSFNNLGIFFMPRNCEKGYTKGKNRSGKPAVRTSFLMFLRQGNRLEGGIITRFQKAMSPQVLYSSASSTIFSFCAQTGCENNLSPPLPPPTKYDTGFRGARRRQVERSACQAKPLSGRPQAAAQPPMAVPMMVVCPTQGPTAVRVGSVRRPITRVLPTTEVITTAAVPIISISSRRYINPTLIPCCSLAWSASIHAKGCKLLMANYNRCCD